MAVLNEKTKEEKRAAQLREYFHSRGLGSEVLDHIDFLAEQDMTLGYMQDRKRLRESIPAIQSYFAQKIVNVRDLEEAAQKKANEEELAFMRQREEELLKQLREQPQSMEIGSFFGGLDLVTEAFAGSNVNALLVHGGAGLGKSYQVTKKLVEKQGEGNVINIVGHATPLAFYKLLYQYRQGKTIVMDDLDAHTLKSDLFVAILKAATWSTTGTRIVSWHSATQSLVKEGIPQSFEFNSKIVVLANSIPDNDEFKAFLSRALVKEVQFGYDDIRRLFTAMASLPHKDTTLQERLEIVDALFGMIKASTQGLSLRLYVKALELYSWDKTRWKVAIRETLQFDRDLQAYLDAQGKYSTTRERIQDFMENTGKSRRSYFYIQNKMRNS